jgi:uncharacterized RDD family membrane protein YckC
MRAILAGSRAGWKRRVRRRIVQPVTTLLVETTEGVALHIEIAGAGSRLCAGLLDGLILLFGFALAALALVMLATVDPAGVSRFGLGLLAGGIFLLAIAYHIAFHLFAGGQTPGKRALGLRVTAADGQAATPQAIVLRAMFWPVDVFLPVPAPLGLIVAAMTARHQRLGDLVAGTLVVHVAAPGTPGTPGGGGPDRASDEPGPEETWSALPTRTLPLTPGSARRLAPDDVALLRSVLTREELNEDAQRKLFVDTARYYAERLELGAFDDARVALKELYLFAREFCPRID